MPSHSTLIRWGGLSAVAAGALYFLGAILIILDHPSAYLFTRQNLPGAWGLPIGLLMVGGLAGLHTRHTGYPGYGPLGSLELALAERVVLLSWRLHRITRYETESIALFQEKAEDDLADKRRFASRVLGADHPQDVRENLKAARSDYRLLKRFSKLEDDKHLSSFDADRILWAVAEVTDRVAEGEIAPEDLLEEISIPGVPDTAEEREDFDGWSAGAVRVGVEAIASATDEDSEELLEVATDAARRSVIGKQQAAEQVERDLERMSRERLLPDDKTLEKVSRYEAHLSRLMFKALHELEALQVRRSGGIAPLARLDLNGLAAD